MHPLEASSVIIDPSYCGLRERHPLACEAPGLSQGLVCHNEDLVPALCSLGKNDGHTERIDDYRYDSAAWARQTYKVLSNGTRSDEMQMVFVSDVCRLDHKDIVLRCK